MAGVLSLAWELLHAIGAAKKNRKKYMRRRTPISGLLASVHFFSLFTAAATAYGGSQARGRIGAAAAGLHHSHSNTGSEQSLRPTPLLTDTWDSEPTEWGQGLNLHPPGY